MKESAIYLQLSRYMRLQHPTLIYHFDTGTGFSMSIGAAMQQKRINPIMGYPDFFLCEPRNGYYGLYIEIKKESIFKLDGSLKKNVHVQEQREMLNALMERGYAAHFGIGLEDCIRIISEYLKETDDNQFYF